MNIEKEINKINSPSVRALARELDRIYPAWLTKDELKAIALKYVDIEIRRTQQISRQLENFGLFLEIKNEGAAQLYRLSAVNAPLGSCIDIAKRRVKRDPMSALLSLSYSQIQDIFNQK